VTDLGLLYCSFVWGSTFYLVKDAITSVHPVTLVAYRFLSAALLLLPWVIRKKKARLLREGAILSALMVLMYLSQTIGMLATSASNSGFITGLFIVFVPIFLLVFLRQPVKAGQWIAVGVAAAGLWVLTGGVRGFNWGDALTLVTAVAYAWHVLAIDRYVKRDADTVLLVFHQFWMTGIACLVLSLAFHLSFRVASPKAAWIILFLTVFPTLSAFFVQMEAQKRVSPVKAALFFSLEPVFAAIFAWTLGGERFRPSGAVGGGLIVAGMVLSELSKLSLVRLREKEVLPG